jgi:serine/threonine protein kinase
LLDALNYLHSHEPPIIHRDIKPQNLKLTSDNQIILLDFGLAKDSVGQTKITTTGSVVGFTPHYAPMEQIRGTGTNPKSDIYSLSATLYQLLTNTVPFDALTRADSLLNGVPDPVQPIHEINKEVPKVVSEIILKGMSVSQEQRFSTAREMQKILRDAYSSMQNQMAAQTIAFNMQEDKADEQVKTEPVLDNYATLVNEPPPFQERLDSKPSPPTPENQPGSVKTEVLNQTDISSNETPVDFDATMKVDDFPAFDSEPKQSDIKTEVFLGDKIPEQKAVETSEYKTPEQSSVSPADATVPLISFDSQPNTEKAEKYDSAPTNFSEQDRVTDKGNDFKTSEEKFSSQPDILKTANIPGEEKSKQTDAYSAVATGFPPPPPQQFVQDQPDYGNVNQTPPPPPQKKSGGKGLLIGGGLFALLILLVGAGVGGWFVYKNYIAVDNPPPTPEVSPSVEITPEITPEPTLADSNTDNTNSEIATTDNTNTDVTNTDPTNTKVATDPTPKQAQTVRPTPIPRQTPERTVNTPRPTPETRRTPVPQSTPRRTDIIKP